MRLGALKCQEHGPWCERRGQEEVGFQSSRDTKQGDPPRAEPSIPAGHQMPRVGHQRQPHMGQSSLALCHNAEVSFMISGCHGENICLPGGPVEKVEVSITSQKH